MHEATETFPLVMDTLPELSAEKNPETFMWVLPASHAGRANYINKQNINVTFAKAFASSMRGAINPESLKQSIID